MPDLANIHVNDAGIIFLVTVRDESGPMDLTSVESVELIFQKPDKTVLVAPCTIVNENTGLVRYVSVANDFDKAGKWKVQVLVVFGIDNVKHSDIGTLSVDKNILT